MDDLLFARGQMALSLGFHIVFAAVGIAMPLLMTLAEWRWLRTRDPALLELTHRWAKGTAVLFAVGAVSGTVLSFELGLLFPRFMHHAGAVIGMPFSLEGFAFFSEAIFLGVYLYGWDRVRPRLHLLAGALVALSGVASAAFVIVANAWMNAPRGFTAVADPASPAGVRFTAIDPIAALGTPFATHEILHAVLASYGAVGFAVAAIHARQLLRKRGNGALHRHALAVALWVAIPAALLQPLSGHLAGHRVAEGQPAKLAAMEDHRKTEAWAPVTLGPLRIPGLLSLLAHNDPRAAVTGLDDFAPRDRPPVAVVHRSFQLMVALGMWMAAVAAFALVLRWRRRAWAAEPLLLRLLVLSGPAGFVALEAGWVVTEVGRQPWVVTGVLRTAQAVTPMPGLWVPFTVSALLYAGLSVAVLLLLRDQVRAAEGMEAGGAPLAPAPAGREEAP